MTIKCGIVGLPNIGKSTLFNAFTKSNVAATNYPFCTINPNIGIVDIPDNRLNILAKLVKTKKITPASHIFVDIAGLVKGASKGEGLGNAFLTNIRETDAIIQVIRCFEDINIPHTEESIDPERDLSIINTELIIKDLEMTEKALERHKKNTKNKSQETPLLINALEKMTITLNQGLFATTTNFSEKELSLIKSFGFLTLKPMLIVGNIGEKDLQNPINNIYYAKLKEISKKYNYKIIPICSKLEADIHELSDEEQKIFLADLGLQEPGLNILINASFDLLNLQTYFTAGVQEVRAWTIPKGATSVQAASVIHTDFAKGFIRAQVIKYEDFIHYNGEQGAKEAGKIKSEGKDYVVQNGDIIHFLFNV